MTPETSQQDREPASNNDNPPLDDQELEDQDGKMQGDVLDLEPTQHTDLETADEADHEALRKRHLEVILLQEDGHSDMEDELMTDADQDQDNEADQDGDMREGLCVECRDQEASLYCERCTEEFCEMCFAMLHRTGNRRKHTKRGLKEGSESPTVSIKEPNGSASVKEGCNHYYDYSNDGPTTDLFGIKIDMKIGYELEERAKYIPLRLTLEERKLLRLLEAALSVSEYTDKIDIASNASKSKRIVHQIKDLCAVLSGLVVARDYKKGQELFYDKSFEENEEFFQNIFEIGRRHKIMNPEKMRDAYGKLMYLLMDSVIPEVREMLSLNLIKPIQTVYKYLEERDALGVFRHGQIGIATAEIIPNGKTRSEIQSEIKSKERAIEAISRKYRNPKINSEEIKQCLYSIGDNHAYLRANRDCCDHMLKYLNKHFHPQKLEHGYSLAIYAGEHGARLSHSHEMQFYYTNQTLALWREIQHEMFMLWSMADTDLLSENHPYKLRDTGQGFNRIQTCPNVSKSMHSILHRAQQKAGYWVGSSVIHLGDRNVPNALMFIDKYNQVSRILNPVLISLDSLTVLYKEDSGVSDYIDTTFGGLEKCKKDILTDFFRYAFDGSGADNFFDAGSCIDGRLTSAWNWCSRVESKPYFPMFLLTGFTGFDGSDF